MAIPSRNPGPILTSLYKGLLAAIPTRWKLAGNVTIVKQERAVEDDPSALTPTLVESTVEQVRTDERLKTDTYFTPPTEPFVDGFLTAQGEAGVKTETYITTGGSEDIIPTGPTIVDATTTALGNGSSIKTVETRTIPGVPQVEQVIDSDGSTKTVTKTMIDAADASSSIGVGTRTEYEPINATTGFQVDTERGVPGNALVSKKFDDFGNSLTVTDQLIALGPTPTLSFLTVDDQIKAANNVEGNRETTVVDQFRAEVGKKVNFYGSTEVTTVTRIAPGDAVPSPTLLQFGIQITPETKDRSQQSITTVGENPVVTSYALSQRGDLVTKTDQVVAVDTQPGDDLLTLGNQLDVLDSARARQIKETVEAYEEFTSKSFDQFGNTITTTNAIVAPGTEPAVSLTILSDTVQQKTVTKADREKVEVDEFRAEVSQEINPYGDTVTTTVTRVAPDTSIPTNTTVRFNVQFTPETKDRTRQSISVVAQNSIRTSHALSSRGDAVTRTEQIVAIDTTPADALLTVRNEIEPLDSARAKQTKEDVVTAYGQFTDKQVATAGIPAALLALAGTNTTTDIVAPATAVTALSATVIGSVVKQQTVTKAEKTVTQLTGTLPVSQTTHKIGAQGQAVKVVQTLSSGTPPTPTAEFTTISDEVMVTGTGLSVRTTESLDGISTYPVLGSKEYASDADGAVVNTSQQTVDPNSATLPAGGLTILDAKLEAIDTAHSTKTVRQLDDAAFPILTSHQIEPETKTPITTTKQIVAANSVLTSDNPLIIDQYVKSVDKWRSIKVVVSLDRLPDPFIEYRQFEYIFPALFYNFAYDPRVGTAISKRAAFARACLAKINVTFTETEQETAPYVIQPVSWNFPLGNTVHDVLSNGEEFTYQIGSDIFTINAPNSSPSRSSYESLIGVYTTIKKTSEKWRGGVYRNEEWQIQMQ